MQKTDVELTAELTTTQFPNQSLFRLPIHDGIDAGISHPVEYKFTSFPTGQTPIAAWITSDFEGVEIAELHFAIQNLTRNGFSLWITNCFSRNRFARGTIKLVVLHSKA
jgi:hypothetical protein